MKLGTRIRINKGQIETLIQRDGSYGLFKSETYQIVRSFLKILENQILPEYQY